MVVPVNMICKAGIVVCFVLAVAGCSETSESREKGQRDRIAFVHDLQRIDKIEDVRSQEDEMLNAARRYNSVTSGIARVTLEDIRSIYGQRLSDPGNYKSVVYSNGMVLSFVVVRESCKQIVVGRAVP